MTKMLLFTIVLVSVAFCVAGLPRVASGQAADGKLLDRYTGLMNQLSAELTAQIPKPVDEQQVQKLLAGDALDPKLVTFVVLHEGTPEGLAAFAGQGKEQAALVEQLLADPELMKQMLVADGANRGKYGPAMEIYTAIQKASTKAKDGILQRLALAMALEFAAPKFAHDPVKRYLNFEKAYLDGELDPGFPTLDTWSLRFVVNGDESEEMLAWGREMLRNLRPDHIRTTNRGNRYSALVRTNVIYGSGRVQHDRSELNKYQNMLMNGGTCGRRAFFGQYILRCFGNPAIKRPSTAHGALARWTPNGWAVNLGPGWGKGSTDTIYDRDSAFLASSQARMNPESYMQVKRAMWIGDLLGEKRQYGGAAKPGTWSGVSLVTQRRVIHELKAVVLEAVDEKFGEANESEDAVEESQLSPGDDKDKKIRQLADGEIEIPIESFRLSVAKTKRVFLMDSYDGGKQLYLGYLGRSGRNIYRGGSAKGSAGTCSSAKRIRDNGRGGYPDWGMRLAMTPESGETTPEVTLDLGNGVSMEFVYIKPGTFIMGSDSAGETKFTCSEAPKHEVTITKGYYLGKYEVTRDQFGAAFKASGSGDGMKKSITNSPAMGGRRIESAEKVSELLSEKTGRDVFLPTEAQWEYAARAGTSTSWFFGDDSAKLGDYAWYTGNSGKNWSPKPVGQKKPNPWGLYDMYGNVWELVADTYSRSYFANSPKNDPTGPGGTVGSQIEYTVNVPQAGKYALTADVVTMNYDQMLNVAANDDTVGTRIALPFTCGMWQDSEPVVLNLKQGENILKFSRMEAPQYGIAVKSFTLKRIE